MPGDELLPAATVTLDRETPFDRPPGEIWPWIAQLGKQRAAWYLAARLVPVVRHRVATAKSTG